MPARAATRWPPAFCNATSPTTKVNWPLAAQAAPEDIYPQRDGAFEIQRTVSTQPEMSSPSWLATAKKLSEKVHHHLKEEEQKFFQSAGKLLSETQKKTLAGKYLKEFDEQLEQAS